MSNASLQPKPNKTQKRDEAREKARQLREEQAKRSKRNRVLWQLGGIVGVLAIATAVFFGYQSWQQGQVSESAGPKNMISDGLIVTAQGPTLTDGIPAGGKPVATTPDPSGSAVNITVYYDYLCPYCGQFEAANGAYLQQLAQNGASVEMHPIAILTNNSSGTRYSERAANAFACVANSEPQVAMAYNALLFSNQPKEGSAGLDNAELKKLADQAGVTETATVDRCIDTQQFKNWVQAATARALGEPIPNSDLPHITGTPTVLVNGLQYTGSLTDPNEFKAFVVQASSETSQTATPTPTP